MSDVKFNDRLPLFRNNLYDKLDDALKSTARDALVLAKTRAPYSGTTKTRKTAGKSGRGSGGQLRADSNIQRQGHLSWRINFEKEYAGAQEAGTTRGYPIRNYTTPGTGAHYLERSGDEQIVKLKLEIIKHGQRAKAY